MAKGLNFPNLINRDLGIINIAEGAEKLAANMRFILSVPKGSLPFDPDTGVDIMQFLFEPNDDILEQLIEAEITSEIGQQLNVQILRVEAERTQSVLKLDIYFRDPETNQEEFFNTEIEV